MLGTVAARQLLAAASSVMLTIENMPDEPVRLGKISNLGLNEAREIMGRYVRHGSAIIRLDSETASPDTLVSLAEALGMDEPFLPPLYTMNGHSMPKVTRISAALNSGTVDAEHPSFGRTQEQRLHCDGTLQEIGFIKTGMLFCESPAAEGGDTTLFNSSAAYAQLVDEDLPAALALATPGVLVRRANINECVDENAGPAFTVQDGQLVCGYSVTDTDEWVVPDVVEPADLRRGIEFLDDASRPGSPYYRRLALGPGEAIILDNTRISHGRTAYRDSPARHRCLYRSLHLEHPRPTRRPDLDR
ncbi:MAG: TauD/TfdA family dioxygenase [Streptosporangiaceae bacterium]|nr:TauD/TfdA family dioxygenase [Streptosporangiaceae bacterium]